MAWHSFEGSPTPTHPCCRPSAILVVTHSLDYKPLREFYSVLQPFPCFRHIRALPACMCVRLAVSVWLAVSVCLSGQDGMVCTPSCITVLVCWTVFVGGAYFKAQMTCCRTLNKRISVSQSVGFWQSIFTLLVNSLSFLLTGVYDGIPECAESAAGISILTNLETIGLLISDDFRVLRAVVGTSLKAAKRSSFCHMTEEMNIQVGS